ncbi:MAG: succinyl-diaminopimelate desuccinylase [Granulosicoccus sp.]
MNTTHSESISLLIDLVQRESVTPDDKGCQALIAQRLEDCGFSIEWMNSGDVTNLWARRGTESPLMVFAGHTDVVPTGDTDSWTSPPFSADIIDGYLCGRGAADMKGGVAAAITAIERFIADRVNHGDGENVGTEHGIKGSIAVLLTSDEEGPAIDGTVKVIETLQARQVTIDYCIVGEPSSTHRFGDIIRNGRRGSLGAHLIVKGKQGHVAYPHMADNPVHRAMPALLELTGIAWDEGDEYFPPTTLQISNINAGTGASNVIPGTLSVEFNLRYGPATTIDHIKNTVTALCENHHLDFHIEWKDSAQPFITQQGTLTDAVQNAIQHHTGSNASLDTGGGTSDGRFIAPTGAQVIEFGALNTTIHQIDERTSCKDIDTLSSIYESVLKQLLTSG